MAIQSRGTFVHGEILAKANFASCYMTDEVVIAYRPRTSEGAGKRPFSFRTIIRDLRRVFFHPIFIWEQTSAQPEQSAPSIS